MFRGCEIAGRGRDGIFQSGAMVGLAAGYSGKMTEMSDSVPFSSRFQPNSPGEKHPRENEGVNFSINLFPLKMSRRVCKVSPLLANNLTEPNIVLQI